MTLDITGEAILRMLLYVGSLTLIGAAAFRLVSHWTQDGAVRLIAAAPVVGTVLVAQSMGFGLAGLGADPAVLSVASFITWLVTILIVPAPTVTPAGQFSAWWLSLGTWSRVGVGALFGATFTFLLYFLVRPYLVGDTVSYHIPLAISWVHDGQPGSLHRVYRLLAVENYPLVDEVLLSWQLAISGSLVPLSVWPLPLVVVGGVAAVTGLVRLGASRMVAIAGATALLTTPLLLVGLFSHATDAATLGWLLIAAALVACSREHPVLIAPALLSAALSIGTRTQSAPVLVAVAVWAVLIHRPRGTLRPYRVHLAVAALLAGFVGGFWYLRNIVLHGSPFWPAVGTPWGDASSSYFDGAPRFLDQPFAYFTHVLNHRLKAGGIPLLLAGILTPLISRRTAARTCAAVAALGTFLWMFTPFSGETAFATTRYLFPMMAAATVALVIAAGQKGRLHVFILALLLASVSWNLFQLSGKVDGFVSPILILAGAAAASVLALVIPAGWPGKVSSLPGLPRTAALVVVVSFLLAAFAPGYLRRQLDVESERDRAYSIAPVARWLAGEHRFITEDDPIAMTLSLYGPLTGDRLQHSLGLVGDRASCRTLDRHAAAGWLILRRSERSREVSGYRRARDCLGSRTPVYDSSEYVVFSDKMSERP